jgi:glycosyltransferase involved in cell wall biosynthesis
MHIENQISYFKRSNSGNCKFSILIPSWNNLPYLKLCLNSIAKNSVFQHQVIVHVNDGSDSTLDWVKSQPLLDYTHSTQNVGVCYALNAAAEISSTDYIVFMNDDMYACPGWDEALLREIESIGHNYFFLSGTAIEPNTSINCAINGNYGTDVESFNEEKLLNDFKGLSKNDWMGSTWPPNVVHKTIWELVGGYSIEYTPGMYSDPDFSMKLWKLGVRHFKGVAASRVYHFGSLSVKRVVKNGGYFEFIRKWGMTSSTFTKYYLRRGKDFTGPCADPVFPAMLNLKNLLRRLQAAIKNN